ncbi:platelet glycoprotein Ib alpha chain isoform X2 [Bradysia coprophila]|nr:platelet glycoprotein Ib alpha chain isoform X2 [Bradysia coprophila]
MREHGYYRSAEEINTRIKNLKCFYNRIKKDVELGVISEPTWKHYQAMEEIITRPVFGNRVQQPHLYNALQQQKTNSQDAKYSWIKKMEAEDDSNELRPEDLLSVEEEPDDEDDDDNNEYDEDDDGEMDFEDASLVPKEEPIDIDDEAASDVADADDIFPKLSQYLQLASNQQLESKKRATSPKISDIKIKQSPPSTPATPTPVSTPTPTAITSTVTTTAPVVIKPTTQSSKISLVPTNILMKPTATSLPQSSLNFSPQLFCAKSASGTQTVYTTTSNGVPMKVLLVNALQTPKRLPTQQTPPLLLPKTVTTTATKLTTTTGIVDSSKTVNKLPTTESLTQRNGIGGNVQINKSFISNRESRNETRGFKGLLHRLINIQNESLGISKQRLKIERQRFEFEQNIGKKLLSVLTKMASNGTSDPNNSTAVDADKS